MAKIVFYTHDSRENLARFEYYQQDIDALKALGHEVVLCTRLAEIPWRFDAIFVWWWTRALVPVLLGRLLGRPCIVTGTFNFRFPEDHQGRDYFRRPRWQRVLISLATRLCSLNLFVSQMELEQCSSHFGLRSAGYLPHCLHGDYLLGPAPTRRNALLNVSWSGMANLVRKGVPELLEAVALLRRTGIDVRLSLAGLEGDGAGYLRDTIARLDIGSAVTYIGEVSRDEKIRLLRQHEVYVQPSHFEGFGLATLEAMGCGACVIVCDVGAVKEVVADCGIYARPHSPEALADAIRQVLEDAELRHSLQVGANQRAREMFGFDRKVERLRGFLAQVNLH